MLPLFTYSDFCRLLKIVLKQLIVDALINIIVTHWYVSGPSVLQEFPCIGIFFIDSVVCSKTKKLSSSLLCRQMRSSSMYVVVNNFNSDKFTKLLNNTRRYSFFLQLWQRIHHSFKFLVHINDRLLKVGLLYSNVN